MQGFWELVRMHGGTAEGRVAGPKRFRPVDVRFECAGWFSTFISEPKTGRRSNARQDKRELGTQRLQRSLRLQRQSPESLVPSGT